MPLRLHLIGVPSQHTKNAASRPPPPRADPCVALPPLPFAPSLEPVLLSSCAAVLVRELRNEVSRLLAAKVRDPSLELGASKVVEAMHHLLSSDGF